MTNCCIIHEYISSNIYIIFIESKKYFKICGYKCIFLSLCVATISKKCTKCNCYSVHNIVFELWILLKHFRQMDGNVLTWDPCSYCIMCLSWPYNNVQSIYRELRDSLYNSIIVLSWDKLAEKIIGLYDHLILVLS